MKKPPLIGLMICLIIGLMHPYAHSATRPVFNISYSPVLETYTLDNQWIRFFFGTRFHPLSLFFQTGWFNLSLTVALISFLLAAIIIFVGYFTLRVKFRERQLHDEQTLRLNIAGDLHDEVGSMLTTMSMQADLLLSGHPRQEEGLKTIAATGHSALDAMVNIVWSIDPRNDDQFSLVSHLEWYARKTLEVHGITVDFVILEKRVDPAYMHQQVRRNIMLIYKEVLTNICRHSSATRVRISFSTGGPLLKLSITDNGKGFSGQVRGHGLRNMGMRAKAIGATLRFPEVDQGVAVVLEMNRACGG